MIVHAGLLLPESFLASGWFAVLAAFVAVNTLMYIALALVKIVPKVRIPWSGRSRRSETRSIHPDAPI